MFNEYLLSFGTFYMHGYVFMHGYIDFSDILPTHILLALNILSCIWTEVLPCCKICKKRWVIVSSSGMPYLIAESL